MHREIGHIQPGQHLPQDVIEGCMSTTEQHETGAGGQVRVAPVEELDRPGEAQLALAIADRADVGDENFARLEPEASAQDLARMLAEPRFDAAQVNPSWGQHGVDRPAGPGVVMPGGVTREGHRVGEDQ